MRHLALDYFISCTFLWKALGIMSLKPNKLWSCWYSPSIVVQFSRLPVNPSCDRPGPRSVQEKARLWLLPLCIRQWTPLRLRSRRPRWLGSNQSSCGLGLPHIWRELIHKYLYRFCCYCSLTYTKNWNEYLIHLNPQDEIVHVNKLHIYRWSTTTISREHLTV